MGNLLRIAPGGHVGRFVIWTESAFQKLDTIYGTWTKKSKVKQGYNLPMPKMKNSDLSRLLKSDEVQKAVRPPKKNKERHVVKRNPLKNPELMYKLNPYSKVQRLHAQHDAERRRRIKQKLIDSRRGDTKYSMRRDFYQLVMTHDADTGGKARPRNLIGESKRAIKKKVATKKAAAKK